MAARTAEGEETVTARYVIGATGVFTQPKPVDIPGVESFTGTVIHSARWDDDDDLLEDGWRSSAPAPPRCRSSPRSRATSAG